MVYRQNLHTHTNLCDGKDAPEQMVLAAIEKGFDSIGFSGHSYMDVYSQFSMGGEKMNTYRREIARLTQIYAERIKIFCGLEMDNYSPDDPSDFDYVLGSVHCVQKDGETLFVDWTAETVRENVEKHFAGDAFAYAAYYFHEVAQLPKRWRFDIIAHFDLLTKFNEREYLIDVCDPRYRRLACEALEELAGKVPFFEINTGAISRGYRSTPYPDPYIIKQMKHLGFGAVITSDCHDCNYLDCGFDMAEQILKDCGYTTHFVLTDRGFEEYPLLA